LKTRAQSTARLRDLRSAPLPLPRTSPAATTSPPPAPAIHLPPHHPQTPFRLFRRLDSLPMRALRRLAARFAGRTIALAAYGSIAAAIGLVSAWYMTEAGTRLTVERDGPWARWTLAGSPDADPYTQAHFSRAGWLPLSAAAAVYFTASRDSTGEPLFSDCDYTVSGVAPAGRRWTLAAYDLNGGLLEAGAGASAIASDTALPQPGGGFSIALAQSASPGNWLNTSGAARMQLVLTVYGMKQALALKSSAAKAPALFRIERTGCR